VVFRAFRHFCHFKPFCVLALKLFNFCFFFEYLVSVLGLCFFCVCVWSCSDLYSYLRFNDIKEL
jgi:hypothetical protein